MKIASSMTAIRMKGSDRLFSTSSDDEEDGDDGHGVDHLEVVVGGVDHVLHAGRFADEHAGLVILLQDGVEVCRSGR